MTSDEHKLDDSKHFSNRPSMLMNRTESFSMCENEINYLRVLHYYTPDDPPPVPLHEPTKSEYLEATFWDDCQNFRPGSVPHSAVVGTAIGIFCGLIAFVYYFILEQLLDLLWHQLPALIFAPYVDESLQWLWIPVLGLTMAFGVGLTVKLLGEPGDLSYTVQRVHGFGFIGMDHVLPMLFASQFSILGGGSLGPEAPLVAICASFSGYISRKLFRQTHMNVIRKHTLMGMSCALAAFFGVPLGGSLFALEINNRMGIEYYEHVVESIFSGTVCLCVFRGLTGQSFGAIWDIEPGQELGAPTPSDVILGAVVGLLGATVAWLFASFHKFNMGLFNKMGLLDDNRTVQRALLGASVMLTIGVLIPRTMFWGEEEFDMIATAAPASELPNVWPTNGLLGLEIVGFWSAMLVGVAKMVAISYTVAAGYRGGFIFPFFAAGAAFGKGITFLLPSLSPTIMTLCFSAGINVAITRTALATTLILCALAGEINAGPPVLAASMISLLSTSYMPFIRSQVSRSDIARNSVTGTTGPTKRSERGDFDFDGDHENAEDFDSHHFSSNSISPLITPLTSNHKPYDPQLSSKVTPMSLDRKRGASIGNQLDGHT